MIWKWNVEWGGLKEILKISQFQDVLSILKQCLFKRRGGWELLARPSQKNEVLYMRVFVVEENLSNFQLCQLQFLCWVMLKPIKWIERSSFRTFFLWDFSSEFSSLVEVEYYVRIQIRYKIAFFIENLSFYWFDESNFPSIKRWKRNFLWRRKIGKNFSAQ